MPKKLSTAPSRRHWSTISERTSDEPLKNTGWKTPRGGRPNGRPGSTAYFYSLR
jgi:hypothetical protein